MLIVKLYFESGCSRQLPLLVPVCVCVCVNEAAEIDAIAPNQSRNQVLLIRSNVENVIIKSRDESDRVGSSRHSMMIQENFLLELFSHCIYDVVFHYN